MKVLAPPFPWFGGKRKVAAEVWRRFGDVPNLVEPFFGSGAVLFCRPHWPWDGHRIETVNDADCFLANFWRAVKADPEAVAAHADWPVNEIDLHARHRWLVNVGKDHVEACREDPEFFDAKIAGWWVWGICQWIGSGWCRDMHTKQPRLATTGKGTHRLSSQIPDLYNVGRGVHRPINQLPMLDNSGNGVHRPSNEVTKAYFEDIANRLSRVRVCCGDWSRIMGPSVTFGCNGAKMLTGVFLDPPYTGNAGRKESLYSTDCLSVGHAARTWAIANGDNQLLRIALCGYEGEHDMPASWSVHAWKAVGGYGNQSEKNENARRERIWFSPHCIRPEDDHPLFADDDESI